MDKAGDLLRRVYPRVGGKPGVGAGFLQDGVPARWIDVAGPYPQGQFVDGSHTLLEGLEGFDVGDGFPNSTLVCNSMPYITDQRHLGAVSGDPSIQRVEFEWRIV